MYRKIDVLRLIVKFLMVIRGLNKKQLLEKSEISAGSLNNFLNGKSTQIKTTNCFKILKALDFKQSDAISIFHNSKNRLDVIEKVISILKGAENDRMAV